MCRWFLIVVIFNIGINNAQINNVEVFYKVKILKDEDQTKTRSMTYESILNEVKNIEMVLKVEQPLSFFSEVEALDVDGKTKHFRKMAKNVTGLTGKYYCDYKDKLMIVSEEFDGLEYQIKVAYDSFKWKLLDEIKIINGYTCHKATTIKTYKDRKGNMIDLNITAWYSPELSFPLGPKNYIGLPGLILELHEGKELNRGITYYVSKIILNSKKKIEIEMPQNETVISEKEYSNITEKAYENLMDMRKN